MEQAFNPIIGFAVHTVIGAFLSLLVWFEEARG
jgi:hypothetical protein